VWLLCSGCNDARAVRAMLAHMADMPTWRPMCSVSNHMTDMRSTPAMRAPTLIPNPSPFVRRQHVLLVIQGCVAPDECTKSFLWWPQPLLLRHRDCL
jgi:hypothetical protein